MKANIPKAQKMPHQKMHFECDPNLNIYCSKKSCFINDGPCHATTKVECASKPIRTAKLVMPMSNEEALDLVKDTADKATLQAAIDENNARMKEKADDVTEATN